MSFQFTAGRFKGFASDGSPLASGRLYSYASGTTTHKAAYTDATLGAACTYVSDGVGGLYIALDSKGEAQLWLGSGAYTFKLTDSSGSTVWTVDGVQDPSDSIKTELSSTSDASKGSALVGGVGRVVDSIAALKALPKTGSPKACVTGYYAAGDGGGGQYFYDPSDVTSTDNGGTIIVASDGGRWKLTQVNSVSVKQFGAKGNGVTDDSTAFQSAIDVLTAGSTQGTLRIPSGAYKLGATLSIPALKYLSIVGDGTAYLGTRLLQGFNGHMFTTPGAGGGSPAVWSIANVACIGDRTTYSSGQWCAIYMTADAVGMNVYNCVFQNFNGWGINVANLFASTFQRNIYFGNNEGGFQNTGGNTNNFLQETTQVNRGGGMYIAGNGNCMTALHLEGDLIRNNPAGENLNYYALKITGSQNVVSGGNIYTDPNNNKTPIRITAYNNTLLAFAGAGKGTSAYFVTLDAGAGNQLINGNIASTVTGDASAIGSSWLFGISPMVPLSNGEVLFNTGSASPPAGAGLHVGYDTTNLRGYVNSTNPGVANLPLDLLGSYVALRAPFGSNQTVSATTLGSVIRKLAITNESGAVLGYIPIYNTIT